MGRVHELVIARVGVLTAALALGATVLAMGAGAQAASAAGARVVVPRDGSLVTGPSVRVQVRHVGPGFRALVGARDVTARFHRSDHGRVRTAVLRRGRDFGVGTNRLSVGSGRGRARRYVSRSFVVGRRRHGLLSVNRRRGSRSALRVRIREARHGKGFESVAVRLDGRRVATSDWALGHHVSSSVWPLGQRSFDAMFGSDDGLRHGPNRLTITAWRADGTYDRASLRVRVNNSTPLITAGRGARTKAGRRVRLHGHATRAGHRRVGLRWQIVRAPKGSHAHLRRARSARPSLVPDLPGRYRVRLIARAHGHVARHHRGRRHRHGPPAFTGAVPRASVAVDEATVEAAPDVPAIGESVQTITASGAISLGGQTYTAQNGAWAQMLVLDAGTLEVESNQSFGDADDVTPQAMADLAYALQALDSSQIAVVSGGGRSSNAGSLVGTSAFTTLRTVVSQFDDGWNTWPAKMKDCLFGGSWSLVGNPNTDSATANVFGLRYGSQAGQASPNGALTGYLQQILHVSGTGTSVTYGFASGNVTSIDTDAPGAPAGVNRIQVGSQSYDSEQLQPGFSGFHVLVLNDLLQEVDEGTFPINGPPHVYVNPASTSQMVTMIQNATQSSSAGFDGAPGNLVIVQTIGSPSGYQQDWVWDGPLISDTYGQSQNTDVPVPRNAYTWGQGVTGQALAAYLGMLGGTVAHDQIAELGMDPGQPSEGYTLIASTGQLEPSSNQADDDSVGTPIDDTSVPVSQVQLPGGSKGQPQARIVATLSRDHQSLWKADTPSALPSGSGEQSAREIAYQPPQAWPQSGAEANKANAYIAQEAQIVGANEEPVSNVRDAYDQMGGATWNTNAAKIQDVAWPGSGYGFTQSTFLAVRNQLHTEALDVATVWERVASWQGIFGGSGLSAYVDLQTFAKNVIKQIKDDNASYDPNNTSGKVTRVLYIIADSLWIAGDAASVGGYDTLSSGLSAMSGVTDLFADTTTTPDGQLSAADVSTTAAQLGPELVDRYQNISQNIEVVGDILVDDWGKLQAASTIPSLTADGQTALENALNNTSQREIYKTLLSTFYGVYVVDPAWVMSNLDPSASQPKDIQCVPKGKLNGAEQPFDNTKSPSSWWQRVTGVQSEEASGGFRKQTRDWFGISSQATFGNSGGRYPSGGALADYPNVLPQKTSSFLLDPLIAGGHSLGMEPAELFGDTRFPQWWFYCDAGLSS